MARVVWRQFAIAFFCVLVVFFLLLLQGHSASTRWADSHGGFLALLLLELPGWVINGLPLAAGVAVALLPLKAGAFPVAVRMLGIVLAVLVLYDIVGRGAVARAYNESYIPAPGESPLVLRLEDTTGILQRALAHARGVVRPEDITKWPPAPRAEDGRFTPITDGAKILRRDLVYTLIQASDLLLPFLLMGLSLGFGAWLGRIATFKQERDERMLRLAVAWGLAIGVPLFLGSLSQAASFNVSMRGQWMGWLFLPGALALIPAYFGWRAVWRLDRLAGE